MAKIPTKAQLVEQLIAAGASPSDTKMMLRQTHAQLTTWLNEAQPDTRDELLKEAAAVLDPTVVAELVEGGASERRIKELINEAHAAAAAFHDHGEEDHYQMSPEDVARHLVECHGYATEADAREASLHVPQADIDAHVASTDKEDGDLKLILLAVLHDNHHKSTE